MVIALAWLVGLQASLLADALGAQEESFRTNVWAAMEAVVDRLEASETTTATMYVFGDSAQVTVSARTCMDDTAIVAMFGDSTSAKRLIETERKFRTTEKLERIGVLDTAKVPLSALPDKRLLVEAFALEADHFGDDSAMIIIQYSSDSVDPKGIVGGSTMIDTLRNWPMGQDGREGYIARIMQRLALGSQEPILTRIDTLGLDSLVRAELIDHGVTIAPILGVVDETSNSLQYRQPSGHDDELLASEFRAILFPGDLLSTPNSLVVFLPGQDIFLWKQIAPMVGSITLFMLVIVLGFGFTIRTIVAQRRTARLMVDFVNNMTHEFKTPISTVALACEAIMRPDVAGQPDQVRRFSTMIRDENRRMRHQAEKILQMAALEESRDGLKLNLVDLHSVIREAVESISLQVESRDGKIEVDLSSRSPEVLADRVHLTGIIFNLLDNANKYSPDKPYITVRTADEPEGVRVSIQDRGLGLKPEDQKRIFQKYFRVSQGNVHDVKGFGLGLSYVDLMVRAHGGRIEVDSEPGAGTRMSFVLPRPPEQSNRKDRS
jgi:two-component system phosphate regulon sensor histidine kinase PhoR